MGGIYKLQNPSIDDLALNKKSSGNEYLSTPEKKAKYKALSKNMATKLAFKNLKATLFKNHGSQNDCPWLPKPNYMYQDSTEASSEGE